jgi:septal ring factor EnvC (AmiA/AmiB activator)
MDVVLERLVALEMKVREALAELEETRRAWEMSEEKVRTLEVHLRSREQEIAALVAQRERDAVELTRMRAERDEVRGRVEGLLGEIARLEAAVQAAGV